MNNVTKRICIIILAIFMVLSTGLIYTSNAAENENLFSGEDNIIGDYSNEYSAYNLSPIYANLRGRLIIESSAANSYDDGDYIPYNDLVKYYDVLCRQHGTKLPTSAETQLKGSNGDKLDVSFPYLTMENIGDTLYKEDNRKEPFGSEIYTNLTYGYYVGGKVHIASPKEAYILSEMVNEFGGALFYYDIAIDENGNKIKYEGSLENSDSFVIGDTEIYIIDKQFVVELPNGDLVYAEAVTNESGETVYTYKNGNHAEGYELYEGNLTWNNPQTGEVQEYPSFVYNHTGITEDRIIPNGTKVYITGSNIVVKKDGEYYEAAKEGNNSYVQLAWWTTVYGSLGKHVDDTPFSQEADAFEAYILRASGVTDVNDLKYKTMTIVDENGEEKTVENAFDFEYNVDWVTDGKFETPTVSWDERSQTALIGPLAIDYVDSIVQFGNRPEIELAAITGMDLYTDASDEPLVFGEDWELVYLDGERTDSKDPVYPKANEEFYIRILNKDIIENSTKITNIKTYFRYMNAAGSWQELNGKYFKATWNQKSESYYKTVSVAENTNNTVNTANRVSNTANTVSNTTNSIVSNNTTTNETKRVLDYTQYWLQLDNLQEFNSQSLALGINGSKWYEYKELDRKIEINSGKIVVEKQIVDENGEASKDYDPNEFFEFKVIVNGAENSSGEEILKVKAGESAESKVYYWLGEEAPTYEVTEISKEGYTQYSIENANGSLDKNKTVKVVAKNIAPAPNEARIEIIKKIQSGELSNDKYSLVGKTFYFNLNINGTFEYDGVQYTNTSMTINNIPVVAEGNSWTSNVIKWRGQDNPTYSVVEVAQEGSQLISIIPDVGTLVKGETIKVVAINEQKIDKGAIHIIKTLEGSKDLPKEYIDSLEFTFDIKVEGYEKETITLKTPTTKNEKNEWVWEGYSSEYVWAYGNNPTYEVKEVNVPEGTEFVSGSPSGILGQNGTITVDAYITNRVMAPKTGKIQITKNVEDKILYNKEFSFAVIVEGTFNYKGNSFKNARVQITQDGCKELAPGEGYDNTQLVTINIGEPTSGEVATNYWESDEFSWYEDAPTYKVEENVVGENIAYSIEPSSGTLADYENSTDKTVKVTAWNRSNMPKAGYLHIIKTLENADKISTDYIKSLIFKFKIEVEGYESTVVSLSPKYNEGENTWVWEYTSDRYSWAADQEAPNYTITEIELPEGTEFVNAEGDGTPVEGKPSITGQLKESVSQNVLITTDNKFINKVSEHSGYLKIEKKAINKSLNGKEFEFEVTLKGPFEYNGYHYTECTIPNSDNPDKITVKAGEEKVIGPITWYGEKAPTYTIKEKDSDIANNVSIVNGSGTIKEGGKDDPTIATATFTNESKLVGGRLSITKNLTNSIGPDDQKFYFKVTVQGYEPYIIGIKKGETYISELYKWYVTDQAPTYKVEEINIPDGVTLVDIRNAEGTLKENETSAVEVVAENQYEEHSGKFNIKKVVLDEKLIDAANPQEFSMKVKIQGKYFAVGNDTVISDSYEFTIKLKGGETFTSPEIKWWGNEAPTVTVEEYDLPLGWQNVGISNNGSPISENSDLEIVVTNKLPVYVVIDLTTKLAGQVWEDKPLDEGKNTEDSVPNGVINESENAIAGVEVYVYKVVSDNNGNIIDRTLATVYKDIDGTELSLPIITGNDGTWQAPRVKIPTVTDEQKAQGCRASYDVDFIYDGQTYEPTKFLATSNGDVSQFLNAQTAEKDKFAGDSMALDYDRDIVNNRIQSVSGKTVIDGNGVTTGTASGTDGENNLTYKLDPSTLDPDKKAISKLVTTNSDGTALDLFKTTARTSVGGLTFPFARDVDNWGGYRLYYENTSLTELGVEQKYYYEAVYNYCLHINLGLVRRTEADLGLAKDLYSAKVSVRGEESLEDFAERRFNTLQDLVADRNGDAYTFALTNSNQVAEYKLGLYSTDYYYRAEMYLTDAKSDLYDQVVNMEKTIPGNAISEMEVDLKYQINVYNESGSYIEKIKSINDYYDSSFGTPLSVELNGTEISNYYVEEKDIIGSDKVTYNKLVIDNLDINLESGQKAELFVTFRVQKETIDGIRDTIIKGQKSNVAEIASYATYNLDGSVAGKIDKDSAPANLNIRNYNEKSWYEDDTDSAPVLKIEVKDAAREISGVAWEDRPEEGTSNGNGIKDDDEALIGGLTTELIEKVNVGGDIDYDFLWPTNEPLNSLGGKSLKDVTGFDSTIETAQSAEVGSYKFEGVPSGQYVVRFLYGNDKTQLEDTIGITNTTVALKEDGTNYSGNDKILTANYDNDMEGKTPAVYNGQDYKSTIYQSGFTNTDDNGYLNNKFHDLSNEDLENTRVSDVRDSEARRLEMIANSETITNSVANILATANDKNADHTELFRNFYMYADTAVLNLTPENANRIVTSAINIDCGLIERPENKIVLDKEISSIKLTTNDQRVIFNAMYDINYNLTNNPKNKVVIDKIGEEYLVADITLNNSSVGTDVMQALDKYENKLPYEENEGRENFKFINVDDTILQGTTIEINYAITALNVGDVDYTSETLENLKTNEKTIKQQILEFANEVKLNSANTKGNIEIGKYLGRSYYTGNHDNDTVVTTRVRQIIDYVDNNAVYSTEFNVDKDHGWRNTTASELSGSGYESQRLLDRKVLSEYKLEDSKGVLYMTDQKNSLILSIDSLDDGSQNAGFETKLVPYLADSNSYKSQIGLTVTKTVSAQDDANDLTYDNLAEIVKYENSVGRKDALSIPGNANPKLGEFDTSLNEPDSSATELVTFIPPTGIEVNNALTLQILIIVLIALVMVSVGIVIIKKKVL